MPERLPWVRLGCCNRSSPANGISQTRRTHGEHAGPHWRLQTASSTTPPSRVARFSSYPLWESRLTSVTEISFSRFVLQVSDGVRSADACLLRC